MGDDTSALDAVLHCDTERLRLLEEEHQLMELIEQSQSHGGAAGGAGEGGAARQQDGAPPPAAANGGADGGHDALALTQRLAAVGKRLHDIGEGVGVEPGVGQVGLLRRKRFPPATRRPCSMHGRSSISSRRTPSRKRHGAVRRTCGVLTPGGA